MRKNQNKLARARRMCDRTQIDQAQAMGYRGGASRISQIERDVHYSLETGAVSDAMGDIVADYVESLPKDNLTASGRRQAYMVLADYAGLLAAKHRRLGKQWADRQAQALATAKKIGA